MNDELEDDTLRRLLEAAAKLPREAAPPANAWRVIRGRIDASRVQPISPEVGGSALGRPTRWWPIAAAAALLLVAGTAIVTQRGQTRKPLSIALQPEAVPLPTPPETLSTSPVVRAVTGTPVALASSNPALAAALNQYQLASHELEAAVVAQTAGLPPATREVVRRSIETIDSAIADLRAALGSDPRNASLGQYLAAAYQQKLDFLKRVRAMPGAGM